MKNTRTKSSNGRPAGYDELIHELVKQQILLGQRFDAAVQQNVLLGQRFDAAGERMEMLGQRFDMLGQRLDMQGQRMDAALDRLEKKQDELRTMFQTAMNRMGSIEQILLHLPDALKEKIGYSQTNP